ncbi:uncharacterized protein LOC143057662 [Mytilus galloprovincialis]|uniref:uncharacterized protein LOC143057662 n=1 Tax=Mytilus galloprovincialis TaxID=29158 RepID=UPI003F7C599A
MECVLLTSQDIRVHVILVMKEQIVTPVNCSSNPCIHGQCNNGLSGYTCSCLQGITGSNCNTDCDPNLCLHNGVCHNSFSGYSCTCQQGYIGQQCQQSHPCEDKT